MMSLHDRGIMTGQVNQSDAGILIIGCPGSVGVTQDNISKGSGKSGARRSRFAKLEDSSQKIPSVDGDGISIGLELNDDRRVVFASAVVLPRIIGRTHFLPAGTDCGSTGLTGGPCVLRRKVMLGEQDIQRAGVPVFEAPLATEAQPLAFDGCANLLRIRGGYSQAPEKSHTISVRKIPGIGASFAEPNLNPPSIKLPGDRFHRHRVVFRPEQVAIPIHRDLKAAVPREGLHGFRTQPRFDPA